MVGRGFLQIALPGKVTKTPLQIDLARSPGGRPNRMLDHVKSCSAGPLMHHKSLFHRVKSPGYTRGACLPNSLTMCQGLTYKDKHMDSLNNNRVSKPSYSVYSSYRSAKTFHRHSVLNSQSGAYNNTLCLLFTHHKGLLLYYLTTLFPFKRKIRTLHVYMIMCSDGQLHISRFSLPPALPGGFS